MLGRAFALIAFLTLLALGFSQLGTTSRPVLAHAALGLGALPMILLGMVYFTPVLTRSSGPHAAVLALPGLALAGGALAVHGLAAGNIGNLRLGAVFALLSAAGILAWAVGRGRRTLGRPHAGLAWYLAALGALLLGLGAILAATLWPAHWAAMRYAHVHLNLLGLVALTALGTLEVLLPTTTGCADPGIPARLRRNLYPAVAGALAVASAVWWSPLAWLGALLWAWPVVAFLLAALRQGAAAWHGPSALLAAAPLGLLAAIATGALNADGLAHPAALSLFLLAFMLPLVTGAVGYLLPVLVWPGPQTARHHLARRRLNGAAGLSALVYLAGGAAQAAGQPVGHLLALIALAAFLVRVPWALAAKA
jgi:hypothetical protein